MNGAGVENANAVDRLVPNQMSVSVDDEIRSRLDGLGHLGFKVPMRGDDPASPDHEPHGWMIDDEIEATGIS